MTKSLALSRCRKVLRANGWHTAYRARARRPYVRIVDRHRGISLTIGDPPDPAEHERMLLAVSSLLMRFGAFATLAGNEIRLGPPYFDGRAPMRSEKVCARCGHPFADGESYGTINGRWEHLSDCDLPKPLRVRRLLGGTL